MFNVTKQKTYAYGEFVADQILEIYVLDEGQMILLYPSVPEVEEIIKEIGENEFDFTPYCG